ncbi:LysR substrate-binding domain-containing protein [Novosphingobium sp. BL-8H]|uniref:LysR substrate-binding domain-containing protein n=1 Tax=Novosphingobium sp. BL-8H TaxID=3127640 RepID=UPI0037576D5D
MSRRTYDLPTLTTLTTFEAAARLLSFKNAAVELNVTPGAVSHQVKQLESELGLALFRRRHRGVELTREGGRLFATLAESFTSISRQLRELRQLQGELRVRIGTTSAVASLWTSSSLAAFWHDHPEITIDQMVSDEGFGIAPDLDMYIRYGRDHRSDWHQQPLYRDELVPVATPQVAARLHDASLETLAAQRLIYLESSDPSWTSWDDWFAAQEHVGPHSNGFRVNSYLIGLHTAMDGVGLILGWKRLIAPFLESGRLEAIRGHSIPAPRRFHLITRPEEELSEPAKQLRAWLLDTMDEIISSEV